MNKKIIGLLGVIFILTLFLDYRIYTKSQTVNSNIVQTNASLNNNDNKFTYSSMLNIILKSEIEGLLSIEKIERDKNNVRVTIIWNKTLPRLKEYIEHSKKKLDYKVKDIKIHKNKIVVYLEFTIN